MVTPLGETNAHRCQSVGNFNQIPLNKCNVAMDTIDLKYTRLSCVDSNRIIERELLILCLFYAKTVSISQNTLHSNQKSPFLQVILVFW